VLRSVNSRLAILQGQSFLGTLDSHVIALDAKAGKCWDVTAFDYAKVRYTRARGREKYHLVGVSGGEYGIRGFIDGVRREHRARASRRFYTLPVG